MILITIKAISSPPSILLFAIIYKIFINNKIKYNQATGSRNGTITITGDCVLSGTAKIQNNTAMYGAALYVYKNLTIYDSVILSSNKSTYGGGDDIYVLTNGIIEIRGETIESEIMIYQGTLNIYAGTIGKLSYFNSTQSAIININHDFVLNEGIELLGVSTHIVNVTTELSNQYILLSTGVNFSSYYLDTNNALVTYADSVKIDPNDFVCDLSKIVSGEGVANGNSQGLYLITDVVPATGFVDKQLIPMIAIALISMLIVAHVVKVGNKRKSM